MDREIRLGGFFCICWFGNIQNRALDFTSIQNKSTLADMRVLGRTRLSRSTEESTSIERQRGTVEVDLLIPHDLRERLA